LSLFAKWLYSEVKMAIERKFASEPTMLQYLTRGPQTQASTAGAKGKACE